MTTYEQDEGTYRILQTVNSTISSSLNLQFANQRSGGTLPTIYLALVDKYGQIVGSNFDSTVLAYVNSSYNSDPRSILYPPVIEGTNSFTTYGGVLSISNFVFTGSPGYNYSVIL